MGRFPAISITEQQILDALNDAQGHQGRAASALGITQAWLSRWLKENGYAQVIRWVKQEGR